MGVLHKTKKERQKKEAEKNTVEAANDSIKQALKDVWELDIMSTGDKDVPQNDKGGFLESERRSVDRSRVIYHE